jgi:hypothetical protein
MLKFHRVEQRARSRLFEGAVAAARPGKDLRHIFHGASLRHRRDVHGTEASIFAARSSVAVNEPRARTGRLKIENQHSIWFSHDACFGVR